MTLTIISNMNSYSFLNVANIENASTIMLKQELKGTQNDII